MTVLVRYYDFSISVSTPELLLISTLVRTK